MVAACKPCQTVIGITAEDEQSENLIETFKLFHKDCAETKKKKSE